MITREPTAQSDGSVAPERPPFKHMVWISSGTFLMGSPPDEEGHDDTEGPQHEVEITKPFYLGVYPVTLAHRSPRREGIYTTLLMSTGLTFGTISSLFGLSHGIIDQGQYSILVAAVIGSAVVPTLIANAFYLPHHLLPETAEGEAEPEPIVVRRRD